MDEDMEVDVQDDSTSTGSNLKCKRSAMTPLLSRKKRRTYIPPKDACIFDGRLLELADEDIDELDSKYTDEIGEGSFGKVFKRKYDTCTFENIFFSY